MKDVELYLSHMVEAIDRIASYIVAGEQEFMRQSMIQDAVIRNLEVIGEAAKRVPDEVREGNSAVPWRRLSGLRDVLIHQYEGVDLSQVWRVASDVLPELRDAIAKLLA